mmetsp:Transcript_24909/g.69427  ORF Transcript_24909/g.69427 Transcript_24909/m.69427 type:complete len:261 (+) Transcript_24909:2094-2876(+)
MRPLHQLRLADAVGLQDHGLLVAARHVERPNVAFRIEHLGRLNLLRRDVRGREVKFVGRLLDCAAEGLVALSDVQALGEGLAEGGRDAEALGQMAAPLRTACAAVAPRNPDDARVLSERQVEVGLRWKRQVQKHLLAGLQVAQAARDLTEQQVLYVSLFWALWRHLHVQRGDKTRGPDPLGVREHLRHPRLHARLVRLLDLRRAELDGEIALLFGPDQHRLEVRPQLAVMHVLVDLQHGHNSSVCPEECRQGLAVHGRVH